MKHADSRAILRHDGRICDIPRPAIDQSLTALPVKRSSVNATPPIDIGTSRVPLNVIVTILLTVTVRVTPFFPTVPEPAIWRVTVPLIGHGLALRGRLTTTLVNVVASVV